MKFRVTIRKDGAADEQTIVTAESRFAVYDQVRDQGGTVVSIEEDTGFAMPAWLNMSFGTGVKRAEIVRMTKNLSAMLNAGLPLSRALSVLERQSRNKQLKKIVTALGESVRKGDPFHTALAKYPSLFSELYVAMTQAGEESGALSESLSIVGTQMESTEALIRKVKGAMIYPAIVITAVVIVGILMLMFVVPTLTNTFVQLHVKVPMATQVIVDVSNFMVNNTILMLVGIVVSVVGGVLFVRSKPGSAAVLWVSLRLPVIGELVRETFTSRAARTLASLLASGVPVLDALAITRKVVGAQAFANVIDEAAEHVRKGQPLSAAFVDHPKLYPILMGDMLSVGEETGKVADMLKQIAEFYEADVSEKTKDLSTIIEPVLMLVIGAGVGVFAVAIISPIYSLSSAF